jgi:hypothetical protein
VLADDLHLAAEGLRGPVDQTAGEALVRPDLPDAQVVQAGPQQRVPGPISVLHVRRDDMDGQEQTEGVGDDEPLAPLDLLARVKASRCGWHGISSADRL